MLDDARILVTGGSGFIGSTFILHLLERYPGCRVVNLDKLTYASNPANLRDVEGDGRYRFVRGDICDARLMDPLMSEVDAVFNFAILKRGWPLGGASQGAISRADASWGTPS